MAAFLYRARLGGTAVADSMVGLDAASHHSPNSATQASIRISGYPAAEIRVGNLYRSGFYQFFSLFSCDLVALLPGTRAPSFVERDVESRCPRFSDVGNFRNRQWKAVRSLDLRRRFADFRPQRLHALRAHRHWYLFRPFSDEFGLDFHRDARPDRGFFGHQRL